MVPRAELRHRVLASELTIGAFVNLGSPVAAELVARAGFDWVVIDLEHGAGTEADLHPQLLAVQATPTGAIVRVPLGARLPVGRALDAGADGLMIPRLETLAEITETLTWMRYPPAGVRGVAGLTRGAGFTTIPHAELAATVNPSVLGVFQVESPVAVEAAEAVAALDGVDVLFVGPADLSHSMGIPGQFDSPRFVAALDQVAAACRAHGKAAGILLQDPAAVAAHVRRGFRFIAVGSDTTYVTSGAAHVVREARAATAS
jgi:2-dehydro-3-deoxyglucarate aldolase/4-hydroxy-2-oxoheptanedioate aldolase